MSKELTVAFVDDDEFVRKTISSYLKSELFNVLEAENGQELRDIIAHKNPDIILLDMILPDCDGMSLLSEIKKTYDTPVIIMSSRSEDIDRIIGIESGADDYLSKPVSPRELKARIHAVLGRVNRTLQPQNTSNVISFDEWTIDPSQYQVFDKKGESANLTTSEFIILHNLVLSPRKVFTRDQLFEITRQVNSDTYDRAVDIQITRIRKKISDSAKNSKYIKTVRGIGYLFCGQIDN